MILITQFWNFETPKRREEIYKTLLKNASNRYINKIYVFSENNLTINFTHNKIVSLTRNHRMSYYDFFKVVNQNFRNQICIISNADIYFNESIVKLNQFDFKNKIIALSSHDCITNKIEKNSIDSWFLKSMNLPYSEFKIGKAYDDLRLIKILRDNKIELINPSKEILSFHMDDNKLLKSTPNENLDYITPSKLNEIPVIEEMCNIQKVEISRTTANITSTTSDISIIKLNKKIAVVLHLYYQDLWTEFSEVINNLTTCDFDLYVTLTKDSSTLGQIRWIKEKIEKIYKNVTVLLIDNKGLDVGAFLKVLEYIYSNNKDYEYLLKLHTKKSLKTAGINFGSEWRKQLYDRLIGNSNVINKVFNILNNDNVGMIGDSRWVSEYQGLNKQNIDTINNILVIKTNNKKFIGGTMFWIKYDILKEYFNNYTISEIYKLLETDYFTDVEKGTYTHALERVFGQIVSNSNKIITSI